MQRFQLQKQGRLLLNKSQTIIEVFISIIIFVIAFVSLVILANRYLIAFKTLKERIVANLLAQEGLELVIAKRNQYFLQGPNISFPNSFCIDYDLTISPSSNPCELYLNNEGFYTIQNIGTPTIFKRLIKTYATSNYIFVTSTVEFENNKINLETILTEWR